MARQILRGNLGMAVRLFRQLSCRLESFQDSIGVVLALLDIRLVERVNAEQVSGDGRRKLPPEELSTYIIAVTKVEPLDRAYDSCLL
jgi:hypothetical protein